MLSVTCLLPLLVFLPLNVLSSNYTIDIYDGNLRDIQLIGESSSTELDLSGMKLRTIEKSAFDHVPDLESLDLSNNSLDTLPDFIFSNLTKLRRLSLSNNTISNVRYLFVGLENLEVLDISGNPIRHVRRGRFFGLTKSVRILTEGNIFWSISTGVFTNPFLKDDEELKQLEAANSQKSNTENNNEMGRDTETTLEVQQDQETIKILNKDIQVKLCKSDNIVTSLEILQKDEELSKGCVRVPVNVDEREIGLHEQGIEGFREGWYRLQSLPIASLDLSNNEIVEITKETLNHLPMDVETVNFLENKIRKIYSRVIENDHLKVLIFKNNLIEEIEEDALRNTKLSGLFLADNQLNSLNFVSSLSDTLTEFVVSGNRITNIPIGLFSKFSRLVYLHLDNNNIGTLQNNVFQGLASLQALMLTQNNITTIETDAFKGLDSLETLYLSHNSIDNLQKSTFIELRALKALDLSSNKINRATFADLPGSVDALRLDYNQIDALEQSSFVQVPRSILTLTGNKISSIMRGAFELPTLRDLFLNNNTLTSIDGDSYEGLGQLKRLWLSDNKISEIHKGSCKNLGSLQILDISKNPFERLENGALHGLATIRGSNLYIYENSLKEMHGGLFDDV